MSEQKDFALIFNPSAAAGKNRPLFRKIMDKLDKLGLNYVKVETEYPAHAVELAETYAKDGYYVVGVGGDGTCNEVLNGVIRTGKRLPLGFIPFGTGNDIPGTVGYKPDPLRACEILKEFHIKRFDVGVAYHPNSPESDDSLFKKRYFLGIGSQGFDAEVTRVTNAEDKTLSGTLNYVKNVVKLVFKFKQRPVRLITDGKTVFEGYCNLVAVANGPSYGGGMYICPSARPDDEIFHITIVRMGSFVLLYNFNKMYSKTLQPHPKVLEFSGRRVRIEMLDPSDLNKIEFNNNYDRKWNKYTMKQLAENHEVVPYITQVDGEIMSTLPVEYSFLKGGWEFISPEKNEMEQYFYQRYGKKYERHLQKIQNKNRSWKE